MRVFFDRRQELAPAIWQYYFKPERPVDFVAGQYVALHLPGVYDDPRGASRVFTLTSLPTDELFSFVVKFPVPHSPYKDVLANLPPGSEAKIDDAMGDLILPKDPSQPLVFVAGGIGIASYVSMLRELTEKQERRDIYLFYALRDKREELFQDLINRYHLQRKTILSAPQRLSARAIKDSTPAHALIYISGSQRFVEGLHTDFESFSIPRGQIAFDYYDGYTEL